MPAVPFVYTYHHPAGSTTIEVRGVLRVEPQGLAIEFRERPVLTKKTGVVDESIRSFVIPWSDVQSAEVRESFWLLRPRIVLRTRSLRALAGLPQVDGTEARLIVARSDRGLARELATQAEAAAADHRLRALDAPPLSPPAPPAR